MPKFAVFLTTLAKISGSNTLLQDPEIEKVTGKNGKTDPVGVMGALREMKNKM